MPALLLGVDLGRGSGSVEGEAAGGAAAAARLFIVAGETLSGV